MMYVDCTRTFLLHCSIRIVDSEQKKEKKLLVCFEMIDCWLSSKFSGILTLKVLQHTNSVRENELVCFGLLF